MLYAIAGGLLGARIGYFVLEIPAQFLEEPGGLLWHPGFSFHGAVLGLFAGSAVFARNASVPFLELSDRLAVAGSIGFLLMSLGALLSNTEAGVVSTSMWSLRFPIYDEGNLKPPTRLPIFHAQCLWAALVVASVTSAERRRWFKARPPGVLSAFLILLIFSGLLALDPFKEERTHLAQTSYRLTSSAMDLLMALGGGYLFLRRAKARLLVSVPSSPASTIALNDEHSKSN